MERIPENLFKYCPKLPRQIYGKQQINAILGNLKKIFGNWLDEKNGFGAYFPIPVYISPLGPKTPKQSRKKTKKSRKSG